MADLETHDSESPVGTGRSTGGSSRAARAVISEDISIDGGTAPAGERSNRGEDDVITLGSRPGGRAFSESARKILDNIDKYGSASGESTITEETTETVDGQAVAPAAETKPAPAPATAAPATPAPPAEQKPAPVEPPELAEYRAVNERVTKRNQELLSEVEKLRKAGDKSAPSKREQMLAEADRLYIDDSTAAIRHLIAAAIGADDPKHDDVSKELAGLYQDLTAAELGVALDESKQAKREAARTRQALARDKRERMAEQERAQKPADPDASQAQEMAVAIDEQLAIKGGDGKTVAEAYPLLMAFSEEFSGAKPSAVLWNVIREGMRIGEFDPKLNDDKLVALAAKKIETRYQDLAERIVKARTPTSTAQPIQSSDPKASKETGTSHGTRTLTTQDASVAPATQPAKKPELTTTEKPKYRSEKERRLALARQHAGD